MKRARTRSAAAARCGWLTACALLGLAARAPAAAPVRVGIVFHVATSAAHRAPPEAFIREQLAHANAIYRPLGLELRDGGRETLPERHAKLVTRKDRDALLRFTRRGAIHCMVVATLMDVDEPGRERRGVHWRSRRDARHLVILSTLAGPYVLAHELGHFFGNREHSETPGNLMSYTYTGAVPLLDDAQRANVRRTLEQMVASEELKPDRPGG